MPAISESDFIDVELVTALDPDPNWRERTQQHLVGQGINNQGRVRSDSIAPIEHKGLRFRSHAEKHFHLAMGSTGLPFAPLPVVVIGGVQPRRIEPDFIVWSRGVTLLIGSTATTSIPRSPQTLTPGSNACWMREFTWSESKTPNATRNPKLARP